MSSDTIKVQLTPAQFAFCKKNIIGFNTRDWDVTVAGKAGSDRSFLRVAPITGNTEHPSSILVVWDSSDHDWDRFIGINAEYAEKIPLFPAIYAVDPECGLILEEDCGKCNLKNFVFDKGKKSEESIVLYRSVLDSLIAWQNIGTIGLPHIRSRAMDFEMYLWETSYFTDHCLCEYFGLGHLADAQWKEDRITLAEKVASFPLLAIHRDFQSENIMVTNDGIRFVDYQGGRLGAPEYDVASLLCDPYVAFDTDTRSELLAYYIEQSGSNITEESFRLAAMQRLFQAMGAYANLSLHKGKPVFATYIAPALEIALETAEGIAGYESFGKILRACIDECRIH